MIKYYFDTETIGLNPYNKDSKILTTQFIDDKGNFTIFKEWELGEKTLIEETQNFFVKINYNDRNMKTYNPIFTYNGKHDFNYLMGRVNQLFDINLIRIIYETVIHDSKICDLLQFNNGYFVGLDSICKKLNIKRKTNFLGRDVSRLYKLFDYESISLHAFDDVNILKQLVQDYGYGGRYWK